MAMTSTTVTVSFTLTDNVNIAGPFQFIVSVINQPPTVSTNINDFSINVGKPMFTKALGLTDPEGAPVILTLSNSLPSFMSLSGFTFTFSVGIPEPPAVYTILY
jgi:hypothetical protein